MWMSAAFTLREVSAATEATTTDDKVADRGSKIVPSSVPTARSNVMSMLSNSIHSTNSIHSSKTSIQSDGSTTNVMSMLGKNSNHSSSGGENNTNTNIMSMLAQKGSMFSVNE